MKFHYISATTPWPKLTIRHSIAECDHVDKPKGYTQKLTNRYLRFVDHVLWRHGPLTELAKHGLNIYSGKAADGNYLVLSSRQRQGFQPRQIFHLFHGPQLEQLVKQAKEWAKRRRYKPQPWSSVDYMTTRRAQSGRPCDYFDGVRLPSGITANELTSIPDHFSVSLKVSGRVIETVRCRTKDVMSNVQRMELRKKTN